MRIRRNTLDLLKSYLNNRTRNTKTFNIHKNKRLSYTKTIDCGLPKGLL